MSNQSYFKQFSLALVHSLVPFDPVIGPYQVVPILAIVNLGTMAVLGYSALSKTPALVEPHHQIV